MTKPETQEAFDQYKELSSSRVLSEVLAKIEEKDFWGYVPSRSKVIRVEDVKEILSEYFAQRESN